MYFLKTLLAPFYVFPETEHERMMGKTERDGELELEPSWPEKKVILVTLYQQQKRDKRVRECLCREIPLQKERESMDTADAAAGNSAWVGGRIKQFIGPLQAHFYVIKPYCRCRKMYR